MVALQKMDPITNCGQKHYGSTTVDLGNFIRNISYMSNSQKEGANG